MTIVTLQNMYKTIQKLAVVGVFLAIYLLVEQITQSPFRPCSINATINCDAVISGAVSKTLGIPTPIYGLVGYIVIFVAATLKRRRLLLAMSAGGLAFCMYIAYRELFQLHTVCPVCIACQLIMITVFTLSVRINRLYKSLQE